MGRISASTIALAVLIAPAIPRQLLVAGEPGSAGTDITVFSIGEPDGTADGFGLVRGTWHVFAREVSGPVVFSAERSPLSAWPCIHPSTQDTWAGGTPHRFTIRFDAPATVAGCPLFLTVGLADSHPDPSMVEVAINGHPLPAVTAPRGSGSLGEAPLAPGPTPATMVFPLEAGAVAAGPNDISITLSGGSWIIYDFLSLATRPWKGPPELLPERIEAALGGSGEIVFAVRRPGKDGHWYANFSYYAADAARKAYGEGGRLAKLDVASGRVTTLFEDPRGTIRDPEVHHDGRAIVFAYRPAGDDHFHLHEIQADGSGLRRLTDGPWDDIEPTWLPDGSIVFLSSRCRRWVNCWLTQVAVLHRADRDGGNIRPLSSNNEHDNTPAVLPDGRILYTRWEYVDRSQVDYHHLWVAHPDGTGQTVFFGNQSPGTVMIDARPLPGSDRVICIFSPGHGAVEHAGWVTIVDPGNGPDRTDSTRTIPAGGDLRDPFPLSADVFLASRGGEILALDLRGRARRLLALSEEDLRAGLWCHEPRPLRPRPPERLIPPRSRPGETTGRFVLANVQEGRSMAGVRQGEIKKLLVLETLPKPINFTGGMEPLSYGGTFTLERILGTVPVEPDGSAYFEAPALRSIFFVALDAEDLSVKRMQSFTTVQPGETTGCVGCHEDRTRTVPRSKGILALRRPPSRIEPVADAPDVLDFPRDIQPIIDRRCVPCHGTEPSAAGGPRAGGVILTGDRGPVYSHAYFTLSAHRQVADGRNLPRSGYPPRTIGSSASELLRKLEDHHPLGTLDERDRLLVRLWIETGAPYPGTYAALGTGMVGGYRENSLDRSDLAGPAVKAARQVLQGRCGRCHEGSLRLPDSPSDDRDMPPWAIAYGDPRLRFSRHILYNLSRPERSLLLLAPLAKEAGGYGICRELPAPAVASGAGNTVPSAGPTASGEPGKPAEPRSGVLASADDPDYRSLLASIEETQARLERIRRFDMAGFRPDPAYLREMRRYGILDHDPLPEEPVDPYALDRAYWESLWYRPPAEKALETARP